MQAFHHVSCNPISASLHLKINPRTIEKNLFHGNSPALLGLPPNLSLWEVALLLFAVVAETVFEGQNCKTWGSQIKHCSPQESHELCADSYCNRWTLWLSLAPMVGDTRACHMLPVGACDALTKSLLGDPSSPTQCGSRAVSVWELSSQ